MTPRKQAWFLGNPHLGYDVAWMRAAAGGNVASALFDRMEEVLEARGKRTRLGLVRPDNIAIIRFLQRPGALLAWRVRAQGVEMECYRALVRRSADS